jgi:hypothetical protein
VALPVGPTQQLRNVVLQKAHTQMIKSEERNAEAPVAHVQPLLRGRICFVMKLRCAYRCI